MVDPLVRLSVALIATACLLVVGWALGWVLLWRPAALGQARSKTEATVAPLVSVVVPARDEEDRLPLLLDDLAAQTTAPGQVLVVDDGSEDQTAAVAIARSEVQLISAAPPPPGWTGKSWAVQTGVVASSGDLLVLVDADVRLAPTALSRLLAVHEDNGGLVSVQPRHDTERPVEALSLLFNVVAVMGLGIGTPRRRFAGWGAAGPVLMVDRSDLDAAGGYEAVRGEVAEDLALASAFRRAGRPVTCLIGGAEVRFRMYRDLRGLLEGWRKNMATGARRSPPLLGLGVALWIAALGGVAVEGVRSVVDPGLPAPVVLALYLAVAGQLAVLGRRVGRFGAVAAVWPLPVAVFIGVFTWSAFSTLVLRRVTWSGRSVDLRTPRRS